MQKELRRELLVYLHKPGFGRVWAAVKDKLERLDRVGGKILLTRLSAEEREALQGLLAVNLHAHESCTINLTQLDAALKATRFETTLEECISLLFPDSFLSRRQAREDKQNAWERFCSWALATVTRKELKQWVTSLADGSGIGYRTFRECFGYFHEDGASRAWTNAVTALEALPVWDRYEDLFGNLDDTQSDRAVHSLSNGMTGSSLLKRVRLPIFAAKTIGDSHGLDRSGLTGRLFYWGLVALEDTRQRYLNSEQPETHFVDELTPAVIENDIEPRNFDDASAECSNIDSDADRSLYRRFGILLDDVSSTVLAAGMAGIATYPAALTLWTMERRLLTANPGRVFVVENPSIFGTILERAVELNEQMNLPHGLICTSGRPSLAALRLLDGAVSAGGHIFYNGDMDAAGLQIAQSLGNRYGDSFVAWRMSREDYLRAQSAQLVFPGLSPADKKSLSNLVLPWESRCENSLAAEMISAGVKVFQEHLVDELVSDYFSL